MKVLCTATWVTSSGGGIANSYIRHGHRVVGGRLRMDTERAHTSSETTGAVAARANEVEISATVIIRTKIEGIWEDITREIRAFEEYEL